MIAIVKKIAPDDDRLERLVASVHFNAHGRIKISNDSLSTYSNTYVSLGELIRITGKSGRSLLVQLAKNKIIPVNENEKHENNHIYLFQRGTPLERALNNITGKKKA